MASILKTGPALITEINAVPSPSAGIAFWWLGQNGFAFKGADTVVYIDLYLQPSERRQTPPAFAPEECTNADIFICTHDHTDHIDPYAVPGLAAASPQAPFVVPRATEQRMIDLGVPKERLVLMNDGETVEFGNVRLHAIKSCHEFLDEDPVLGFPYLGFVIEMNGVTFYHTGDTVPYEGLITALQQWHFDAMFLPINGRDGERLARKCYGNCTFQESVDIAGTCGARAAIPMHWDMFANNPGDPDAFVNYLHVKFPSIQTWVGAAGQRIELTPEGLRS